MERASPDAWFVNMTSYYELYHEQDEAYNTLKYYHVAYRQKTTAEIDKLTETGNLRSLSSHGYTVPQRFRWTIARMFRCGSTT